jgi:hypothetical protein
MACCEFRFRSALGLVVGLALCLAPSVPAQSQPKTRPPTTPTYRTSWGAPDLQGVWWTAATVTPLERPDDLPGARELSAEESAEAAAKVVARRNPDVRLSGERDVSRAYNDFWYERGTKFLNTTRASLIIDPSDGRIPALTREGEKRKAVSIPLSGFPDSRNAASSWEERGLWERCITRGLPDAMLPTGYNGNYQIFQSPDSVAILAEMIHDVRVIPLDGRPHVGPGIRQWMGDSRGHWEGSTLVVDTTNFSSKTIYHGSSDNLHLVERFTRVDADTMNYEVTVQDPTTFTRPWTIAVPLVMNKGHIYEYACHEGNRGMENLLAGARAAEIRGEGKTNETTR